MDCLMSWYGRCPNLFHPNILIINVCGVSGELESTHLSISGFRFEPASALTTSPTQLCMAGGRGDYSMNMI